jgi:hypothetical protein
MPVYNLIAFLWSPAPHGLTIIAFKKATVIESGMGQNTSSDYHKDNTEDVCKGMMILCSHLFMIYYTQKLLLKVVGVRDT